MKTVGIVMRLEYLDQTWKWFINKPYVDAIHNLEWNIFPICSLQNLSLAVTICDCLIIPGGYDIHGYYLHEDLCKEATCYDTPQDHFDFACIDIFHQHQKPILGICRGMQLLNVYFKGSLLQHIDTEKHAMEHQHLIHFPKRSPFLQLFPAPVMVNSYHHQVIGKLGDGLFSAAFSNEMYVEALVHENKRILGVQWHPEKMENDQIFPYFFDVICA